jgi:5-formyltetrahydrofolate cyclo-ligase
VFAASKIIKDKLFQSGVLDDAKTVFIYCSFAYEVSTYNIMEELFNKKILVCVPRIIDMSMTPTEIFGLSDLNHDGPFEIPEPSSGNVIDYKQIDVAIIPGVAFDKSGNRIGFGKGMYDQYLKDLRPDCKKISLAYKFQMLEDIPVEPHDVTVDKIFTD